MADVIALVGGDTLLGREIREVFNESSLGRQLKLVAGDEDESGKVVAIDGGISFVSELREEELEDVPVVILAGGLETSRKALAARPSGVVIDLTGVAEDEPEARLRAPLVEDLDPEWLRNEQGGLNGPVIVAHPAAVAIALLLRSLPSRPPSSLVSVAEMRAPSRICWALGGRLSALATDVHARANTIDLKFMAKRWSICRFQQALW